MLIGVTMNGEETLGIYILYPVKAVPQGWFVREHENEHAALRELGVKKFV